jgi:hypothetical protein
MLFVGEKGKILTGFNIDDPQIISGTKMEAPPGARPKLRGQVQMTTEALPRFVQACKTGKQYPGSFIDAGYLTEAVNLYAAALRANKLLKWDAAAGKITNVESANKFLQRDYRPGWQPASI